MTELVADLLPWLAGFYLFDAVAQLRRGQVLFEREGARFRVLSEGVHFAGLWPWAAVAVSYTAPWLPSPDAVHLFDPDERKSAVLTRPEGLQRVPWEALGSIRAEGPRVKAGRRLIFRARSPGAAKALARELETQAARPGDLQGPLRRSLDVEAARGRWARVRRPLAALSALSTLEALLLFGALPAVAFVSTAELRYERIFAALALSHLATVLAAAWVCRRAALPAQERAALLFTLAIFPAYACRAPSQVLRDLFNGLEPLAVAGALLRQEAFVAWVLRERARLQECERLTPELRGYWTARLEALPAVRAPRPALGSNLCGVCGAEYRAGIRHCADCDLPLRRALTG